jgi:hypothetical protein
MNHSLVAGALLMVVSAWGCQAPPAEREAWGFDATAFFSSEAKRLAHAGTALRKTASEGGKSETKIVDPPDWDKELRPFLACGIGQAAWRNSYRVDSARQGESLKLTWTAI